MFIIRFAEIVHAAVSAQSDAVDRRAENLHETKTAKAVTRRNHIKRIKMTAISLCHIIDFHI